MALIGRLRWHSSKGDDVADWIRHHYIHDNGMWYWYDLLNVMKKLDLTEWVNK